MPEANRFAPPKAQVFDTDAAQDDADIDTLDVSDSWKRKFRLIQRAGGPKQPKLKDLKPGERFSITFNILAFLFGPFYYLSKGMWKKGLVIFSLCLAAIVAIGMVLDLLGMGRVADKLGYGAAAVFAVRANIDYYKRMVLRDNGWW